MASRPTRRGRTLQRRRPCLSPAASTRSSLRVSRGASSGESPTTPAARLCSRGAPLPGEGLAHGGGGPPPIVRENEDEIVLANHVDRGGDGVRLAGYLHDLLVRQASGAEPFRDESRDRTRLATAEILVLLHDRDVEMPLFGGGAPGRANVLVAAVAGNGEDANAPPRREGRHHLHQPADRRLVMRVVDEAAP